MPVPSGSPSAGVLAQVLIDSVGLSRVFSYSVPQRLRERLGIGSYVSVPLGSSRSKGWVVGIESLSEEELAKIDFELHPIFRLLGGGPSPEVIGLCKWAAWRFSGSVVNFMTHSSPKRRVEPVANGEIDFESCGRPFRESRGESMVVRIPPSHSRAGWIIDHLEGPSRLKGQIIVVCPTQFVVRDMAHALAGSGFQVASFPDEFEKARDGSQIVVGARNAVFATVQRLSEIIVVDADDPSQSDTSSPTWASHIVARARVEQGQRAIILSSVPTVEMTLGARTKALSRSSERGGWPKVRVGDISEVDNHSVISPGMLSQIDGGLRQGVMRPSVRADGSIDYDGVVVLYNRLGGARTVVCRECGNPVSCVRCGTTLMQRAPRYSGPSDDSKGEIYRNSKEAMRLAGLSCPKCRESYPAICTSCMSSSLKVVTFGIARFRALLEAAIGLSVVEVDAASKVEVGDLSPVVVGTETVFSRFHSAKMVIIADFDHYLYAPRFDARESAMSVLARAARLVQPRSIQTRYVPLYIQTRDVENLAVKAVVEGDVRKVMVEEASMRRALGLPPFGGIVRLRGSKTSAWLDRVQIADRGPITITALDEEVFDLRGGSLDQLLDVLTSARASVPAGGIKFSVLSG